MAAVASAALLYRSLLVEPFFVDDMFIFLRYARNLAELGELSFSRGERVEGFSSAIWTLLLGLSWKAGWTGISMAKTLSLAATALLPLASTWAVRKHAPDALWVQLIPASVLFVDADVGHWGTSGMDSPLWTLGVVLALGCARSFPLGALALGALPWLRPEGPLLSALGLLALILALRPSRRPLLIGLSLAALPFLVLVGLRYAYFHEWVPNTYFAKMGHIDGTDYTGGAYVWSALSRRPVLFSLAAGLAILSALHAFRQRKRPDAGPLVGLLLLLATFVFGLLSHGDWMPNRRLLLPTIPIAAVVVATSLPSVVGLLRAESTKPLALASLFLTVVLAGETVHSTDRRIDQTWRTHERWDDRLKDFTLRPGWLKPPYRIDWAHYYVTRLLAPYVVAGDTIAHVDVGQVPYLMKDVAFLDGFGLVDRRAGRVQFRPDDKAAQDVVREHFFRTKPVAAVVVVDERRQYRPFSYAQRTFVEDPRFTEQYEELTRFPTWGAHPCIVYVRRDREPIDPADAAEKERDLIRGVGDMHKP